MRGASALRGRLVCALLGALLSVSFATPSSAFEFWDGRLQVHGYYEFILRSIKEDFSGANDWDVTQAQHVLNLEIEADIAPDGFGPFDLVSAFARVEVRYDCVWQSFCGIFPSVNMYGDDAFKGRQAQRVGRGRRSGYSGTAFTGDTRRYNAVATVADLDGDQRFKKPDSYKTRDFPFVPGFTGFFGIAGIDGTLGTIQRPGDDPGLFTFSSMLGRRCQFNFQKLKGAEGGVATRVLPWDPGCHIEAEGRLRDKPNPFKPTDKNPTVLGGSPSGTGGAFGLPYRPYPRFNAMGPNTPEAPKGEAQGIFIPSFAYATHLKENKFDSFDQNFSQTDLEWNKGAAQRDEWFLKELYFDLEFFDSRLWIRVGKQNIVWGKTELFRTTDQFNPQDLGLASLPSLEESRLALWAIRGVWSFYEVGPLEDVRLEIAANFDDMEPTDFGRCGEPYAPLPICDKTFGLLAHGLTGVALAGEIRPPDPWDSIEGWEIGARLEFRVGRFSFAVTDFYGYGDSPVATRIWNYSRNVDPFSGRPRELSELMNQGRCNSGAQPGCLGVSEALTKSSLNQQIFAMVCSGSVSFSSLDRAACGQTVFNSKAIADPTNLFSPRVMIAFTNLLSGQNGGGASPLNGGTLLASLGGFTKKTYRDLNKFANINRHATTDTVCTGLFGAGMCPTPLVPLVRDPNDGPFATPTGDITGTDIWIASGVSGFLTDEQEALLGCGPFYRTNCDLDGIDLLNAEASALLQSWPVEGVVGVSHTTTRGAQPGTVGFIGQSYCGRFERGRAFVLPGCRGPGDDGYTRNKDGSVKGRKLGLAPGFVPGGVRKHPFTGARFNSEMAILSWNYMLALVTQASNWDPRKPLRTGDCSFAQPQFCSTITALLSITGIGRPTLDAGGNGFFGRRDFVWASGGEAVIRYYRRNVLGASLDFAEDFTKTNWGVEFTWIPEVPVGNVDQLDGLSTVNQFNLTASVDRPTFINFLNANRTFFFNTQWFFQYLDEWEEGVGANGPWNVFFTLAASTGYFQDRLLPSVVAVYDIQSESGAFLPSVTYRFTESFSANFGFGIFWGRFNQRTGSIHPLGFSGGGVEPTNNVSYVENGLAAIRERDEVYLRIRYTF